MSFLKSKEALEGGNNDRLLLRPSAIGPKNSISGQSSFYDVDTSNDTCWSSYPAMCSNCLYVDHLVYRVENGVDVARVFYQSPGDVEPSFTFRDLDTERLFVSFIRLETIHIKEGRRDSSTRDSTTRLHAFPLSDDLAFDRPLISTQARDLQSILAFTSM
jgi:hypothetical protein